MGDFMSAVKLHGLIDRYNVLTEPTKKISTYLNSHRTLYKIALVVNHLFRAVAMAAFLTVMPFSMPINALICFAGSLFYRLTVETNCAYKFALPAYAGSLAFISGKHTLPSLISGAAFSSLKSLMIGLGSLRLIGFYITYVVLTVDYDVNSKA